jgi:hypothetical protein
MQLHVHVHHHHGAAEQALARVEAQLMGMQEVIARLTREVEEEKTVVDSAIKLIGSIAAEIRNGAGNQTLLTELADKLDAQQAALAAAVEAGTAPAAPPVAHVGPDSETPSAPTDPPPTA